MTGNKLIVTVEVIKQLLRDFFEEKFEALKEIIEQNKHFQIKIGDLSNKLDNLKCYTRRNNIVVREILKNKKTKIR